MTKMFGLYIIRFLNKSTKKNSLKEIQERILFCFIKTMIVLLVFNVISIRSLRISSKELSGQSMRVSRKTAIRGDSPP